MPKAKLGAGLGRRAAHDPRAAALLAAGKVIYGTDESQSALDAVLTHTLMPPSDKALCTELFYGHLRLHLRLDWFVRQKLHRPENLPAELLLLLEQSAYALAHTRLPAHATVNWAVGMARHRFSPGLGNLTNALLRSFVRNLRTEYLNHDYYAQKLAQPLHSTDVTALIYAQPSWLVQLWQKSYGHEICLKLLAAGLKTPPAGLRMNAARPPAPELMESLAPRGTIPYAEGVLEQIWPYHPLSLPPSCLALPPGKRPPLRIWQEQGMISLQSASAYIALFQLIPTDWPTPIWDACAGHGGKTLALLEQGLPIQCVSDPHQGRLNLFAHDFQRLKLAEAGRRLPQILPSRAEQTNFKQKFASVLLDAPCSGLGTLARRPEIRWRRTQDDLERLRLAQVQILDAAHAALIPHSGCRILYITCTLNPAENQNQMQNFLRSHPQYSLDIEYQTPPDSPLGEFFYSAALIRK